MATFQLADGAVIPCTSVRCNHSSNEHFTPNAKIYDTNPVKSKGLKNALRKIVSKVKQVFGISSQTWKGAFEFTDDVHVADIQKQMHQFRDRTAVRMTQLFTLNTLLTISVFSFFLTVAAGT
jgi:hypothetical protein